MEFVDATPMGPVDTICVPTEMLPVLEPPIVEPVMPLEPMIEPMPIEPMIFP
jgi:hypothetical protein